MIIVANEARDYLLAHGGVIHICKERAIPLCGGRINLSPTVSLGEPENIEDYTYANINSIKVYRPRNFESPYDLTVSLQKFLRWKWLVLEGWMII
jgi:hypothetical protein